MKNQTILVAILFLGIGISIGLLINVSDENPVSTTLVTVPSDTKIEKSSTIQYDPDLIFPTREQIGSSPLIHSAEDRIIMIASDRVNAIYKSYSIVKDNDMRIHVVEFDSSQAAYDAYQKHKEYSYQEGGFKYFDVDVEGASCYGEHSTQPIGNTAFCVKNNIYYRVTDWISQNTILKYVKYMADNLE